MEDICDFEKFYVYFRDYISHFFTFILKIFDIKGHGGSFIITTQNWNDREGGAILREETLRVT